MAELASDDQLVAFIKRTLALRDERRAITADIGSVLKEAKITGFDPVKIGEVCRWIEKCDKHGREAMLNAETIFDLYRDTYDAIEGAGLVKAATADATLAAKFAAPPKDNATTRGLSAARAAAELARRAAAGDI